jgi:hypothetical protein
MTTVSRRGRKEKHIENVGGRRAEEMTTIFTKASHRNTNKKK